MKVINKSQNITPNQINPFWFKQYTTQKHKQLIFFLHTLILNVRSKYIYCNIIICIYCVLSDKILCLQKMKKKYIELNEKGRFIYKCPCVWYKGFDIFKADLSVSTVWRIYLNKTVIVAELANYLGTVNFNRNNTVCETFSWC